MVKLFMYFTVYKNGNDCGVNKYICDEDEDTLGSLKEIEELKSKGYVIEEMDWFFGLEEWICQV